MVLFVYLERTLRWMLVHRNLDPSDTAVPVTNIPISSCLGVWCHAFDASEEPEDWAMIFPISSLVFVPVSHPTMMDSSAIHFVCAGVCNVNSLEAN